MELNSKSFMMPIEIESDGKSGMSGGAWTLAFVYSPRGNFLIKGYHREVEAYINKAFQRAFVNYTLWCKGRWTNEKRSREIWEFVNNASITIHKPDTRNKKYRWEVYSYKEFKVIKKFKRMPKAWIPEFNKLYK